MLQKRKNPSRYPSRFGVIPHDFLTTLYQIPRKLRSGMSPNLFCMEYEKDNSRYDYLLRLRFHGMKHFVPYHETVCFKRRNTLFHPVKQADTCQSCDFRIARSFALLVNESGFFCIIISRKT